MEEWKDINGYKGMYQISTLGRVKSLERLRNGKIKGAKYRVKERILKQVMDSGKYKAVCLTLNGKHKSLTVHRLMALVFLNHTFVNYNAVVDHIDNDRANNRLDNLQIITHRENTSKDRKGGTSKYLGVSWNSFNNNWRAQIYINPNRINLGCFKTEIEASNAYQNKLKTIK